MSGVKSPYLVQTVKCAGCDKPIKTRQIVTMNGYCAMCRKRMRGIIPMDAGRIEGRPTNRRGSA